VQRTWWWAAQNGGVQAKAFSVSTVGSPTKPLTRAVSQRKEEIVSMNMLTEQTFDANGVSINYALGPASGSPLLLLHGITERWQTFLPLIPHLTPKWQVYAVDLRGHGQSGKVENSYRLSDYAQDIICFLKSQIGRSADILGHSLGALVAIYTAANQPQQVKALLLVDPPLHLQHTPLKDIPNGPYQTFQQIVEIIRTSQSRQAIQRALVKHFPEGDLEAQRARAEVLSQLDPDALAISLENHHLDNTDLDALLLQIECPTCLVQGNPKRGAALLDEDVDRALGLLRHGDYVGIPEGGHMLHHSHPEAVANALNDFYDKRM
jgi:pimeloyl-ACP methyl ester carboxylesterase